VSGPVVVVLVVVGAAVVWTVRAWYWPDALCRRCKGSKKSLGSTSKRFGQCPRCKNAPAGPGTRRVLGAATVQRARAARRRGKK
jgi:hypothetical protein